MTRTAPNLLHSTLSWTFLARNEFTLSSSFDQLLDFFSSVSAFSSVMTGFNLSNYMLLVLMYYLDSAGDRNYSRSFEFGSVISIQRSISYRILYSFTSTFGVRTFRFILSQIVHPSSPQILNSNVSSVIWHFSVEVRN